jgi:hypothetical protein
MLLADHRVEDALLVAGIAPGEAALDAGMAAIGLAVLVRHHAHQLVAAHFGLEGAADAAIGAGGDTECSGWPISITDFSVSVAVGQACTQAPQETHSEPRKLSLHAGRDPALEAAAGDRQREGALHFFAGAHAARADDALGRIVGEVGVRLVLRHPSFSQAWPGRWRGGCRPHSRSARRAGRRRRPCPAARNRHWRRRSGSRADGRRYRAPSRPCAALQPRGLGLHHHARHHRRGAGGRRPARPSISTRQRRQEPKASTMSVAQSFGICVPHLHGGAHDRGAFRHRDGLCRRWSASPSPLTWRRGVP